MLKSDRCLNIFMLGMPLFIDAEYLEMERICNERDISPENLLEEKLAPCQARILESERELIAAVERDYQRTSFGTRPVHYSLSTTLRTGIITPETGFVSPGDYSNCRIRSSSFLLGVEKPFSLRLSTGLEEDFKEEKDNSFAHFPPDFFRFLYFMERPPKVPDDSWEGGCYGGRGTVFPTDKSRLELYIGDQEAIPFLREQLEGWRYLQLAELLGYTLPITEDVEKKIEEEQFALYEEMTKVENRVRALMKEKHERVELVKATDGVIHYEEYIDLTDEFVENMRFNPRLKETRERVERLLKTAIKRKYHERGIKVSRRMDAGVTLEIDLREFFSQRKAMFEF